MSLSFVTGNDNKFKEVQKILPDIIQCDIDLPEIQSLDAKEVIVHKIHEARKQLHTPFFVEDTSFYINALHGFPGPLGKRMTQALSTQEIYKLIEPYDDHGCYIRTFLGYYDNNEIHYFEGTVHGKLVAARGADKRGFNDIFEPNGYTKTFAEMTKEEKNLVSMRAIAVKQLQEFLTHY